MIPTKDVFGKQFARDLATVRQAAQREAGIVPEEEEAEEESDA